jgi:ABC-type branched-subunit amino acid transport system ATPase component
LITGFLHLDSGSIFFDGDDITDLHPHTITFKGLARTFQGTRIFNNISVKENVYRARHCRTKAGVFDAFVKSKIIRKEHCETEEKIAELLRITNLDAKQDEIAGNLAYGHQSLLGIAMALATEPKLLILDEPLAGMTPYEKMEVIEFIKTINKKGLSIMITEHDMKAIVNLCHRVVVIEYGRKIAEGKPEEIIENKGVIEAYLGEGFIRA